MPFDSFVKVCQHSKIVNFMTLGAGVLVQGRGHISQIVFVSYLLKMHYLF